MANAQDVLEQLTNTWSSMLDKFYDSVADEYLKWMAKEYNMDLKTLREKAIPLKAKMLAKATDAVTAVKTTKKQNTKQKTVDASKYGSMSRKELIDLCKSKSLPVKRKNQDMIEQLKKSDENKTDADILSKSEESEEESRNEEPEQTSPPRKIKKEVKKVRKLPNATPPPKNELLEETLDSESDED